MSKNDSLQFPVPCDIVYIRGEHLFGFRTGKDIAMKPQRVRIYVKVDTTFDKTGFMQPKDIIWNDGKVSRIDQVTDFRPASVIEHGLQGDCYTVMINGEKRHLFFERSDRRFASTFGRWFFEEYAKEEG